MSVQQTIYIVGRLEGRYQGRTPQKHSHDHAAKYNIEVLEASIDVTGLYESWHLVPQIGRYKPVQLEIKSPLICLMPAPPDVERDLMAINFDRFGLADVQLLGIYEDTQHRLGRIVADVVLQASINLEPIVGEIKEPLSITQPQLFDFAADEDKYREPQNMWTKPKESPTKIAFTARQKQDWKDWGATQTGQRTTKETAIPTLQPKPIWGATLDVFSLFIGILYFLWIIFVLWNVLPFLLFWLGFFAVLWVFSTLSGPIFRLLSWVFSFSLWGILALFVIVGILGSLAAHKVKEPQADDQGRSPVEELADLSHPDPYAHVWITHRRQWHDCGNAPFEAILRVRRNDAIAAMRYRNAFTAANYNAMLDSLSAFDPQTLDAVVYTLDSLKQQRNLGPIATARMIISLVQDIPYSLLVDGTCEAAAADPAVAKILQQGAPCVPGQRFGLVAPAEFVATLAGDCDTRTLLLRTILNRMGYDAQIFTSEKYQHSVLGIRLPGQKGAMLLGSAGQNYQFCETTANVPLGICPPDLTDLKSFTQEVLYSNLKPASKP